MKKLILITFSLFYLSSIFCQSVPDRLDSLFKTSYPDQEPGAMVAIRDRNKIIFKKGYGLADAGAKIKIESTTNFNIGSLTKQFTAYAILHLAYENRISLDDKLIKYFPEFNSHMGGLITIRHLLTHSSGIIDHYGFTDTSRVKHATDKDVLIAVKNIDSSYFASGSHYRYSNTAYCLLALIIEKISGLTYHDYIQQKIFNPLGMSYSSVLKIGLSIHRAALGYTVHSNSNQFELLDADQSIFFSTEGDGGIYTSIDDYLKWTNAWQFGNALNHDLIKTAQSPHFLIDTVNKLSYGYGWFVSEKHKERKVYHTGSNGGFRAISFFIPARSYQVVIFSNRDDVDLEDLAQKINRIVGITDQSFTKIESLVSFAD